MAKKNRFTVAFRAKLNEECKLALVAKHNEMYEHSSVEILEDWMVVIASRLHDECESVFGEECPDGHCFEGMIINLLKEGMLSETYCLNILMPKAIARNETVLKYIRDTLEVDPQKLGLEPLYKLKNWCVANDIKGRYYIYFVPIGDDGALMKIVCHLDWSGWIMNLPMNRKFRAPVNAIRESRRNAINAIARRIDDGIWLNLGLEFESGGVNFFNALDDYIIENAELAQYGVQWCKLAEISDMERRYLDLEPFATVEKQFKKFFLSDEANLKALIGYCKKQDLKLHLAYSLVDKNHILVELCIHW